MGQPPLLSGAQGAKGAGDLAAEHALVATDAVLIPKRQGPLDAYATTSSPSRAIVGSG